jgi:cell filamentation protein
MGEKISIRFFDNREVRAIWDDSQNKWWFSVVDVIGILTESANPRTYWSVMKTRLRKGGNELPTKCSQLKLTSADGKKYATDCFSQDDIIEVIKLIPVKNL